MKTKVKTGELIKVVLSDGSVDPVVYTVQKVTNKGKPVIFDCWQAWEISSWVKVGK